MYILLVFSVNADKELLQQIAIKTNGVFYWVNSVKDIDKAILDLFKVVINIQEIPTSNASEPPPSQAKGESVNPKTTVSLKNITIDTSVHQIFLIIKKGDDKASSFSLKSPQGVFSKEELNKKRLISSEHFELFLIKNPNPGIWTISASSEQLQNIIVITTLNLIENLSNGVYFQGEILNYEAYLQQDGKKVNSNILLDQSKLHLLFKDNKNLVKESLISYNSDGVFNQKITIDVPIGNYKVIAEIKNRFFSRQLERVLSIIANPFSTSINSECIMTIQLKNPDLINPDTVRLIEDSHLPSTPLNINKDALSWSLNLNTITSPLVLQVNTFTNRVVYIPLSMKQCQPLLSEIASIPKPSIEQNLIKPKVISPKKSASHQQTKSNKKIVSIPKNEKKHTQKGLNYRTIMLFGIGAVCVVVVLIIVVIFADRYRRKLNKIRDEL